jgi:hypothetical protein
MNEPWAAWIVSLIGAIAVLTLVGVWLGFRILRRFGRIERLIESRLIATSPATETNAEIAFQADSAFGRFLDENPDCKELSKSEQFAAYRNWRKQQGLNWASR